MRESLRGGARVPVSSSSLVLGGSLLRHHGRGDDAADPTGSSHAMWSRAVARSISSAGAPSRSRCRMNTPPGRSIEPGVAEGVHGRRDAIVQILQVALGFRDQHHQVDGHPAAVPVAMRGEQLAERRQALRGIDRREQDRPVPGDPVRPQQRLGAAVLAQLGLRRAERRVAVEKMAGPAPGTRRHRSA
jgi:hypothetical protein